MEDYIKIALTYAQPFWEEMDLPGMLFSNTGPITELYDHNNHERSKYALCSFIDSSLKNLTYSDRRKYVINQLKNVFGVKAEEFTNYEECLWSNEENTFETSDTFLLPHQNNGNPIYNKALLNDKILIYITEASSEFPRYMEGAVHSAHIIAKKITKAQL